MADENLIAAACVQKNEQPQKQEREDHRKVWKEFNHRARLSKPDFSSGTGIEAPELVTAPSQLDIQMALLQLHHW